MAVTEILGHAAGGLRTELGATLLAKSKAFSRLGKRLGFTTRGRYFKAVREEILRGPKASTLERMARICVAHDAAAVRDFIESSSNTCRARDTD